MAATSNQEKLKGNNLYIVLLLVSLLVVGATAIIAKSLIGTISTDTKVVAAKTTANNQLSTDLQAAPQLIDSYQSLGSQQQTLSDALPIYSDLPDLLVTLENMSNSSGLTLTSVAPDISAGASVAVTPGAPSSSLSQPQPYGFTIALVGSYASVGRMLTQLETSARPMRVVGLQLSGTGSDLTVNLQIDTFYQAASQLPFSTETIR